MPLAATASTVLAALRANTEGVSMIRGVEWHEVHLDNCIPAGMSRHVFTGCLGALKTAGLYRGPACDGELALVRAA
jgi:hypothetical protein